MRLTRTCSPAACLFGWLMLGCAQSESGDVARATSGELPEGVVASVGTEQVAADTIGRICRAQGVGPRVARERAVRDALFAAAARADLAGYGLVRSAERAALARALLQQLKRQARRAPLTDAEVSEVTARHWAELDRPVSVTTCHAVARVQEPEQDAPARALAEKIATAVKGAGTCEEFIELAKAVPTGKVKVKVEDLPAVAVDGRVVRPEAPPGAPASTFDPAFTKAAHALKAPGDQSPVVKSQFGYHVILLKERLPERRVGLDERRKLLRSEIMDMRIKRWEKELLENARRRTPVEVLRAATDLTGRVRVTR